MTPHIVILGAGLSGLSTGWYLKQLLGPDLRLTILEKSSRPGGWIKTIQKEDFHFEEGPHSYRSKGNGNIALSLVEALGLEDELLFPDPQASVRYLYDGKNLQKMPKNPGEILFNPLTKGWLKAFWNDWTHPKRADQDESIYTFFCRRLGKEWAERLIDPFVLGIYAGDCRSLSLKSCFPLFDQWESQHGSLLKGSYHHKKQTSSSPFVQKALKHPLYSFKSGMEALPKRLAERLKESLVCGQSAVSLSFEKNRVRIQCEDGNTLHCDTLISTLPAHSLAPLLSSFPILNKRLLDLSYASVIVINLGYKTDLIPNQGFGYLVPTSARSLVLGCIWDSSIFPGQNQEKKQTRLTLMLGGAHQTQILSMQEDELIEYALNSLREQMGIHQKPDCIHLVKAINAIPQYQVGYSIWKNEIANEVEKISSNILLSGNSWDGVSMNDCIAKAYQSAQHVNLLIQQLKK